MSGLYVGIFAFAQATLPLLSALPLVALDLQLPISSRQLRSFYFSLLAYFVVTGILGLLAILNDSGDRQQIIVGFIGFLLLAIISLSIMTQIYYWVYKELDARYLMPKAQRKKITSRQNGRRQR